MMAYPTKGDATEKALENASNDYSVTTTTAKNTKKAISSKNSDKIQQLIDSVDINKNGVFAREEVQEICEDLLEEKEETKQWKHIAALMTLLFFIMFGVLVAGAFIANEASKESHVNDPADLSAVPKLEGLDGSAVRTQNSEQSVNVVIDGDTMVANRLNPDKKVQLVVVGTVPRSNFLDGVNNVKHASRKGTATVTRDCTVFFYDYFVRSVKEEDGDIKIGLEVEDRVMGKTEPKHFTIDCQTNTTICDVVQYFDSKETSAFTRRLAAQMRRRALAGSDVDGATRQLMDVCADKSAGEHLKEACVGDQPLDDETLAAWFALGWTTYDDAASKCGAKTPLAAPTADDIKKQMAVTKALMSAEQIDALFGTPQDQCTDWDVASSICKDSFKNLGYFAAKDGVDVANQSAEDLYTWFLATLKPTYESEAEKARRKGIFLQNIEDLKKLNNMLPAREASEITEYIDQESAPGGFAPSTNQNGRSLTERALDSVTEIYHRANRVLVAPTDVDWTTTNNPKGKPIVSLAVRNQNVGGPLRGRGACDDCWVIAAFEVAEALVSRDSGIHPVRFAEQEFMQCSVKSYNCQFGHPLAASGFRPSGSMDYLTRTGAVLFDDYVTRNPQNQVQVAPGAQGTCSDTSGLNRYKITRGSTDQFEVGFGNWASAKNSAMGESTLMNLISKGPVAAAVQSKVLIGHPKGVILSSDKATKANQVYGDKNPDHLVTLVGYGTETAGADAGMHYWKIKNSWGKSHADNGFIRIERKGHATGIGSFVYWATGQFGTGAPPPVRSGKAGNFWSPSGAASARSFNLPAQAAICIAAAIALMAVGH
jgi:hypothetical protein